MIRPLLKKNDCLANILILSFSALVFGIVVALGRLPKLTPAGFDPHIFALVNAVINSIVSILLVAAYIMVRQKKFVAHRLIMLIAMGLSVLFLLSYIAHHLMAADTRYGGTGVIRYVYLVILITHIVLASIILPFILYTAYRALSGEYQKHKKLARYTFPLWLYVSITGVVVYFMIAPYYV